MNPAWRDCGKAGKAPGRPGARRSLGTRIWTMSAEGERAFHLERAEQCRKMASDATDPSVRKLHEQLAEFHEAEAKRQLSELAANEDEA